MRMRAFSGEEHRIADPCRSSQRHSIARPEHGFDVVPIRKSNRRQVGVLDSVTFGVVIGDVQPGAEPSAVKFESLSQRIPAACDIDSGL
jgi:hypothetical protein